MSDRAFHYLQFCKFCEENSHLDLDPRVHTHSGSIVEGGYISQEKARVAFQAFLYAIKLVVETKMTKPFAGTIENWYSTNSRFFVEGKLVNGNLFGDPMQRFEEGAFIHTSLVVKLDEEKGLLETKNSIYSLGVKDVVTQERYDKFINSKEEK